MPLVNATDDMILAAGGALGRGELVAFPTETVYGLGANAGDAHAVARIFEVKGRPEFNPLIVHVRALEAAREICVFPPLMEELAHNFWPGPLTLVLTKKDTGKICDLVSAGRPTIAVRMPAHPVARALLDSCGLYLAAPSANRSGHVSPTSAKHVYSDFGDAPAYILDGGPCHIGLESTVVGYDGANAVILRPGGIEREDIKTIIGADPAQPKKDPLKPASPGQLLSHYAPRAKLRLGAKVPLPGEAFLDFGPNTREYGGPYINLSRSGNLAEAAANLFSALRELDQSGSHAIAVAKIPNEALGEAINDRLKRAAAPRQNDE